ncbi:aminopeptidase [Flavipsychrobacter stenotrophus]|uniref:Aminopeptidase N n=1 Tax=Flavipsychrobacter stenotrophus TaxID=2077091 RepID=A0A2S7SRM9_9BACT|nr:M1 family metallopeptidase [Flavipsychrobacter stenotrophus]PQJ09267.1 aminopeptidase [Flavipsychrobacter stenotrophus]
MIKRTALVLSSLLALNACEPKPQRNITNVETATNNIVAKDVHTQSNANEVTLSHLDMDIKVDLEKKQISGCALWTIDNKSKVKELKLDTYDMIIDSVAVDGKQVAYKRGVVIPHLGSALHIPIEANSRQVMVCYKTGPKARALQWLDPQQTHDKKFPFLYTQSESIYARSWIPCPDGPGIRFTYTARVTVPKGLMALMSAENPQQVSDSGVYHFKIDVPVPAYLMALAVGDITFKSIDNRTGVYAEPGMIEKARYEFEDVGKMVTTAEGLYGPYRWGRYDMIVLPPGFPIGGMENPRLTFCTPTIIAGDRSLVTLIAHELAHSWSGNLVTNATWNDFWLNEGFTVYFERRIMEQMMGRTYADMLWELGYQDLVKAVDEIGPSSNDTWLKLSLEGRDPDDGLTDIAYEKGSLLLELIEQNVGRAKFDKFLAGYFNDHAFKTITTEEFLNYLNQNLINGDTALINKLNISAWVYGPGIPANCPRAAQERFTKVDAERVKFEKGAVPAQLATTGWTTHEWLQFLRKMPATLSVPQMKSLDDAYKFTTSGNSEIADLWFVMAVRANYKAAYPAMEQFLSTVGRRKFLQPLYGEMMKTPANTEMARQLFIKYRGNYHPLAQETLDKMVLGKK